MSDDQAAMGVAQARHRTSQVRLGRAVYGVFTALDGVPYWPLRAVARHFRRLPFRRTKERL